MGQQRPILRRDESMELRIIVAGSRTFKDYLLLEEKILELLAEYEGCGCGTPENVKFISGTARGADVLGEQFAHTWGYDVIRFPAD